MELVDGKPLAGPMPVKVAVRYAIQIADSLVLMPEENYKDARELTIIILLPV